MALQIKKVETVIEHDALNCPFCDSNDLDFENHKTYLWKTDKIKFFSSYIRCLECHARANEGYSEFTEEESMENAVIEWNKRLIKDVSLKDFSTNPSISEKWYGKQFLYLQTLIKYTEEERNPLKTYVGILANAAMQEYEGNIYITKLKCCPWCGGDKLLLRDKYRGEWSPSQFKIVCFSCHCCGPLDTIKSAESFWNTRKEIHH